MTQLEQVEIQIETAKEIQLLRDNCILLQNSKPFKDVIENGYFKEEAARLVMAKSSAMNSEQMAVIDNMIWGIGALSNYLDMLLRRGADMDATSEEFEQTRNELLVEEASK